MYENISVIYLFVKSLPALDTEDGVKKARPICMKCRKFSQSLNILYRDDYIAEIDGEFEFRLSFNVQGSQNTVLPQVSALFAFAASMELTLVNQFFYTK